MPAACLVIGGYSRGFRDICRSPFHAADAASASSLEQHSISCLLPENGWVTYPSDFSRTPSAGESRISLTCSSPRFLCLFTGFFSGYAAIASEIFPGEIRAAAMGLSYNIGRGLSAIAPFAVGAIAARFGFGPAFFLLAATFLVAALLALLLPETRGRQLTSLSDRHP